MGREAIQNRVFKEQRYKHSISYEFTGAATLALRGRRTARDGSISEKEQNPELSLCLNNPEGAQITKQEENRKNNKSLNGDE